MLKKIVLIGLNELNFDLLLKYTKKYPGKFKNIESLLKLRQFNLSTESKYENLEPWIQWYSIHTGKTFEEHNVFRLGDALEANDQQIYEYLENEGKTIGAVSPMNAMNRLKKPAYFIPDPWTETESDGSFFSKSYHEAISQTVNDNAKGKISIRSLATVLYAFIFFSNKKRFIHYLSLAIGSLRAKWKKALFLDLLTNDIHIKLLKKHNPDFSEVFLNSGAHIQHHYFRNSEFYDYEVKNNPDWYIKSKYDPFKDLLASFDLIVKDYLNLNKYELIFSTGLSQTPIEPTFYYRLKNHEKFMNKLNVPFLKIVPRMTRDFTMYFESKIQRDSAIEKLSNIEDIKGEKLFDEIEIRDDSIFVTLTYPKEINDETRFKNFEEIINIHKDVVFVALKNGKHDSKSYTFTTKGLTSNFERLKNDHVGQINKVIKEYLV